MPSPFDKIRALASDTGSLKARAMRTTGWVMMGEVAQRSLSLLSNLIMTRLLAPEAFGLMAMVFSVHMLVNMISDIGIKQSIVRDKRGDDLEFLQVAWTVQALRAGLVALIVVLAGLALWPLGPMAAPAESVYADPQLPWLIVASAAIVMLRGLESVGMHLAARRLMMRSVAMITVGGQICAILAMIACAWVEPSAWAILIGSMIGAAARCAATHRTFRATPMRPRWNKTIADELWRFGRWLIGASAFGFVLNNGDRFIMGVLLDKTAFGIYTIAALWLQMGLMAVNRVSDYVVNAALAETMRKNRERAPRVLARLRRAIDLMCLGGFLVCALLGPALISALYTPEYAMAGPLLSLLGFRFLARRQNALGGVLLTAGRSDLMMYNIGLAALALVVFTPLLDSWLGLEYAVLAIALAPFAGAPIMVRNARKVLPGIDVRLDYAVMIGAPVLAFSLVAAGVIGLPDGGGPPAGASAGPSSGASGFPSGAAVETGGGGAAPSR